MFGFIKKMFIGLLSAVTKTSLSESLASTSERRIKCISLNNLPCQIRPNLLL